MRWKYRANMNNDQGGRVAVVQQQLFPPPPEFYKLYDEEADGSEDHPLPPLPPKLPTKEYTMFGEIHTVRRILRLHKLRSRIQLPP